MGSAAELPRHLVELHQVLANASSLAHAPEKAQDLVVDIAHLCLKQINENELAFACSELFKKDTGIVSYLQKSILKDEFKGSKEQALDFLLAFVKKAGHVIHLHARDIRDVSLSLYTRDKAAKVKAKTFPLLNELMKSTCRSTNADEMDVEGMLKKFFSDLSQPSKLSQTVKRGIYEILGVFAEYYPETMMNYSDRLFSVLVSTLKQQMTSKTKKPEFTVVAGCLEGLSHLLVNFTQSVEENGKHCREIYQFTSMALDTTHYNGRDAGYTAVRYDIPRAGLNLLARHAAQFNLHLYRDHQMINDRLTFWSEYRNTELKWAGVGAMRAFLQTMASMLVERADKKDPADIAVLKYFIRRFRSVIDDPSSSFKSLSVAIRGYGLFAAPCKWFMTEEDIRFMFNEIVQRSEQQLVGSVENRESELPTYLEALASIVGQLDEMTDTFLASLEQLVVLVFESYPQLTKSGQWTSNIAILHTLMALSAKGSALQGFLSRVVYQWILRTCSLPVLLEMGGISSDGPAPDDVDNDQDIEQDARRVSYKSFIDLWARLLDTKFIKDSDAQGSTYAERLAIHTMIYNELIAGILRILSKLDLSANKQGAAGEAAEGSVSSDMTSDLEGSTSSDPLTGLQPTRPKDFQVFINLVEFTRELLPMRQAHLFNSWVYRFGHEVIQMSSKRPLVSGFYKLLTVCMKMARKNAFFKDVTPSIATDGGVRGGDGGSDEERMDVDGDAESVPVATAATHNGGVGLCDRQACFVLFAKFSKEVLVRLKQYKDDLLASCLFLILSLPHQVIQGQLHHVVPALKTSFKLGLSYLPLAEAGLGALQAWIKYLPPDLMHPYYPSVLPCLDGYLRAGASDGGKVETLVVQMASSRVGRRRIPYKLLKSAGDRDQSQDSPLKSVQLKILRLLGSLGGGVNGGLLETTSQELAKVALAWDQEPRLSFAVPFADMKPIVQLDPFLPRIVELALTSSERQTKVVACEALHTLVLYMLGRGSQQPDERQAKSPMDRLFKKVFPALLQLACDVEQVARQLFEPLVMQLIHWFSGNKKYESEETATLLNAILDGIIHPTDTALRDFCAQCVREFLKWSIKQTTKKQQEKSPINTKSLLKRLYSMASHPSAFKRLGAALAFNHIYTIFREEEALVDQFTFEVLVVFVQSLALAHNDDKSLCTQEQGAEVLRHLERIVRGKAALLNKDSRNRRNPRVLSDACPTLSHVVVWLLKQCGRPQTECRHQCMLLFFQLTPLLPGRSTPAIWMQNTARESGPWYFIARFEGGGYKHGIQKYPTLDSMGQQFSVKMISSWLDLLQAALDCYVWVLGERLLTPTALFKSSKQADKKSVIFQSINYFLDNMAASNLATIARGYRATDITFTPREEEDFNLSKCTVLIRLMDFLGVLLRVHPKEALEVVPSGFWTGSFATVLSASVLKPTSLGFNMADTVIMTNLPKTTDDIMGLLYSKLPPSNLKELQTIIQTRITSTSGEDLFSILPSVFSDEAAAATDHVQLQHLVMGYGQLQRARLLTRQITDQVEAILDCVISGLVKQQDGDGTLKKRSMTPTEIDLGQRLLDLAFQLGIQTRVLIDRLMDSTPVCGTAQPLGSRLSSSPTQAALGPLLMTTFRQSVMDQLVRHGQDAVYQLCERVREGGALVGRVCYAVLEHTVASRELRKRYGMAIHSAVLTQWDVLTNLGGDDKDNFTLMLLKKVLQIDYKFTSDPSHPAFGTVFGSYLAMLRDGNKSLAWKTRVLDILYFFTGVPERQERDLRSALDMVVANHFPLKSTEFSRGSPKYNDYIMALNKILTCLVLTGSLMVLELIISILCRDEKHVYEDKIQEALTSFAKRLSTEKQVAAAGVPFSIFQQERSYPKEVRKASIQRVCIPLLRQATHDAMVTFYKARIHDILAVLEAKLTKNPLQTFENQLISKICYFELVEVLYSRLNSNDLNTDQSAINREYCRGNVQKGNELTTALTKAALGARSEDCRGETVAMELRRQYHCAAYNCSTAIISCVKNEIKFYNMILFNEDVSKGKFFLDNLVDADRQYAFDIEMDAPMERKMRFVAIRSQARETVTPDDSGFVSAHYLSSQYLTDSSLSEDIQQFDFSSGVQHFSSTAETQREAGASQGSQGALPQGQDSQMPSTPGGEYLEMEEDGLNQHECMAALTGVLKHMMTNNITPAVATGTELTKMPDWMGNLHKKLSSMATKPNIKLFIARLIINCQEIFKPYAKFWLAPLMQLIVSGQTGSPGIHYMVLDIMVTLLDWSSVAIPQDQDKRLASRLLEFLMLHSHHEKRQVLKNNLELIKTMVECWHSVLQVPTRVIFDKLQDRSADTQDSAVGVQLLGVIVANQLHPLSPGCDVDEDRFYSALAANLGNRFKAVYGAAAEVIGMAMKQMAEKDKITSGHLHEMTNKELTRLDKQEVFITCIHKIHLHFPAFADRYLNKLLFMLPSIYGQPKTECLEVITTRVGQVDNVFVEMKNKNIVSLLTHTDEADQLTSLKLVDGMLQKLQPSELLFLLPAVKGFISHPSSRCRDVMYSILMWIYDNYKEEALKQESESSEICQILSVSKDALLLGLSDQEKSLRLRVNNFWSHETRLPVATLDRMVSMLGCMYSPETEASYLSYATNLLLEMTSRSPDFKREIFEHPLSECRFDQVHIDHSWRQRHAAISTPLFAETQVGQSQGGSRGSPPSQASLSASSMGGAGQLRATQDTRQFTATQDLDAIASRKNMYDWLTGSQDTFAEYSGSASVGESSSLLFTIGAGPKKPQRPSKRAALPQGGPGGSQERGDTQQVAAGEERELFRLKRRFLKDQSARKSFFVKKAARERQFRQEVQKIQRERRFAQVTMYRQYRSGDLPDIQIKHCDIIAPLQALAQRDSTLARLLFGALFRGIVDDMKRNLTEREAGQCVAEIKGHLNNMLSSSNQFDPAFISCIQEIGFYHSKQMTLDPSSISLTALTSQQLHIGIRVLEEALIQESWGQEEEGRASKRARREGPEQSGNISTWIELARLYKAMGEFDVLHGVFGALINTKDVTQQAIQAEARGDYSAALKLYNMAIEKDWSREEAPQREEEDFWDEARLHCCNQLTRWSDMETFSTESIGDRQPPDLSKIWNDAYQQETYLPYMIRSKLKLLMEGGENDSLLHFVDSSVQDQEKRTILESRFTEELAALSILQEDYSRAKYYIGNCTQTFLQEWSSLGPLMASGRLSKLQNVQKLTEAEQFLRLINGQASEEFEAGAIRLVSSWSKNLPDDKKDPISVWDDVILYRYLYMEKLSNKLSKRGGGGSAAGGGGGDSMETAPGGFDDMMRRERVMLFMRMADSACQQANFAVATKCLKMTRSDLASYADLKPDWTHTYVAMNQKKAAVLDRYERITTLMGSVDPLNKLTDSTELSQSASLLCRHHILASKSFELLAQSLQEEDGRRAVLSKLEEAQKLDKLQALAGCQRASGTEKICQGLFTEARRHLDAAIRPASAQREDTVIADAKMALVRFCDQLLRQQDDGELSSESLPSMESYPETVVSCTLQAMRLHSREARQRFPRILQLAEAHPNIIQTVVRESSNIPSWMFIGWISQMMPLLDKSESLAVQGILKAIAKDYPQALVYPFKISCEDFDVDNTSPEGRQRKEAIEELGALLSSVPVVEDFILALQKLTHPGFTFKDWSEEMKPLLDTKNRDVARVKRMYRSCYQEMFGACLFSGGARGRAASSDPQSVEAGTCWKKFGQDWQKKFDQMFGKDGSELVSMPWKKFSELKNSIYKKMNPGADSTQHALKEYSPWFAAFQALQGDELEIPGQYDGSKKPLPEYHVKIAGFDEKVLTLSSLRKPKRLTVRGDDEQDYPFLVKVGEDLRMDQRIEQLFGLMGGILGRDPSCSQRALTITTYQVIPMTPRLGMIEWMKKTTTLKEFIISAMTETEHQSHESKIHSAGAMYTSWLQKFKVGGLREMYGAMYMKASKSETVLEFKKREARIPWNLLRRAFMQLSASPEAFLTLRAQFARSHAVLCICHYILGIGDRHLSNFLVSLESGRMVGIDFGHSFGSATQFLEIPELMPFRLTNQILNLMLPMKIEGVLQCSMVHTLRALRQNHELLLNTMDVFVKEPSLDWKKFAEMQARAQHKDQGFLEDVSWYPKQKISYARLKLDGANPSFITRKEVELGHSKHKEFCKALKAVCGGDRQNKRGQCSDTGLSVEQQVACLIDQATDPNILGRTYLGWEPWV